MNAFELFALLRKKCPDLSPYDFHRILDVIAENYYAFGLSDALSGKLFFEQARDAVRSSRPGPKLTLRQEQPRNWNECPDCGHVHTDESLECGVSIGGGRKCMCERRVMA